jgi:hypothetical protein
VVIELPEVRVTAPPAPLLLVLLLLLFIHPVIMAPALSVTAPPVTPAADVTVLIAPTSITFVAVNAVLYIVDELTPVTFKLPKTTLLAVMFTTPPLTVVEPDGVQKITLPVP